MNKPKAILFDYGETIIKHTGIDPVAGSLEMLKYTENNNISAKEFQNKANELIKELLEKSDISMVEWSCASIYRYLLEYFDINLSVSLRKAEEIFYHAAHESFYMTEGFFDFIDFLDFLDSNEIRKAIISNTSFQEETLRSVLRKFGLNDRFEFVMTSCDYGYRKPDAKLFELGARKLKINAKDIWYIGDMFEYDVKGAIAAGMTPVLYSPDKKAEDENYLTVSSWTELMQVIG